MKLPSDQVTVRQSPPNSNVDLCARADDHVCQGTLLEKMDPIDWKPKIQGRKRKEINLLFHTARDMYHLERVDPDVIPPLVARYGHY